MVAPLALKDCFIPKGFLVWWALLWLPLLPLCCEYSSLSQPGSPLTPNLATEHQRGFEAAELMQAGWGDWLGLTDTTRHFRRGQFPTIGSCLEGPAAMAMGSGSQACMGDSGGVS